MDVRVLPKITSRLRFSSTYFFYIFRFVLKFVSPLDALGRWGGRRELPHGARIIENGPLHVELYML